jgi:hypothetical protein
MVMLTDARKDAGSEMQVLDVAEIVVQALEPNTTTGSQLQE